MSSGATELAALLQLGGAEVGAALDQLLGEIASSRRAARSGMTCSSLGQRLADLSDLLELLLVLDEDRLRVGVLST